MPSLLGKRPMGSSDGLAASAIPNGDKRVHGSFTRSVISDLGDELPESALEPPTHGGDWHAVLENATAMRSLPSAFWAEARRLAENGVLRYQTRGCERVERFEALYDVLVDTEWVRRGDLSPAIRLCSALSLASAHPRTLRAGTVCHTAPCQVHAPSCLG